MLGQQVIDESGDVSPEELRGQVGHHRAADLVFGHQGAIDEPAAFGPVIPFAWHLLAHM